MVGRFRNPEKSLVAIKTVLDAGLDAAADALDVAYSATGDMVLDDLGKIYIGRQMRVQGQDLPAIELEATEIEWDAEHGEQEDLGALYQPARSNEALERACRDIQRRRDGDDQADALL